jgi:heavy metal sensor kinase
VVDAYGRVVDRTQGLAGQPLSVSLDARVNGLKGLTTFETRLDLGEHPVRVVTVPVQMGEAVPYLVLAAASLEGVEDALRRTSTILLVLTPSVFVLSLLGGRLLVGRSLQPVDEMTRAALAMEPGRLKHRIEPPGTDDEIARLASAFNEMIGRLERSFRQIQQFSADASHELRTPLTSIRGQAEVALMEDLPAAEYRRVLRSIVDDTERMSAIVENLLLLARADAEAVHLKREPVALDEVAMQVYEQMEGIARRKGVALDMEEMEDAPVLGDPLWLGQIVTNLVNNAVKYTPQGGSVTLSVRADAGGFASLAVADTGPGIPVEHLPHIFDRFYRVDSGRSRDAGGVGLGLNIAQWAAESHGGALEVVSEVGKGTTFTLKIPLAAAQGR